MRTAPQRLAGAFDVPAVDLPDWPGIQPRYVAYSLATGAESGEAAIQRDRAAYPGGCMWPFMHWISVAGRSFREIRRDPIDAPIWDQDGWTGFLAWLAFEQRKPVRHMRCSCCGASTTGRQWRDRDTGFGLCPACIERCHRNESATEFARLYGIRGLHFDLSDD